VKPTDISNPEYFHKVVDCQYACPAHTNVPEYIRLIAQGKYTESYLLNRKTNVFPGVLGRTCDRPCEPACRRTRIDEKPVAICRLKRVAADLKGDISEHLPSAPKVKNGKRVALIGAGPASLTVANDLMPLGYEVVIFEKQTKAGGLMRSNIPSFRLPEHVLDEEIGAILNMGADIRYDTPVASLKELLAQGFDAVFVGTGAPRGKELDLPGRNETDKIFLGIDWLESVAFGHTESIEKRVIILGAGNTAMDCCRTARRLGASTVKVMARKPRDQLKCSEWELEDALEEGVDLMLNHAPKAFIIENGVLKGMTFERLEYFTDAAGKQRSKVVETIDIAADAVILAIGQDNHFPWIERDIGITFGEWEMPVVDRKTFMSSRPGVFFGGDAAWGPQNIIWAVEHGHQAAISIHNYASGIPVEERPAQGQNLISQKMGLHEWSYHNDYNPASRTQMRHIDLEARFKALSVEVELGFDPEQTAREVQRCLNCDVQTVFEEKLCIECDACIDICPVRCLTIAEDGEEADLRGRLSAPASNLKQAVYASTALPQTQRLMVKDEDLCVHCGLCAERCPTAAWDMQKFELFYPHAGATRETAK